jgi:beta-xylosidase
MLVLGSAAAPAMGMTRSAKVVSPTHDSLPTLGGEAAGHVTPHGATLRARVNPRGHRTSYWFEYGPSISYGARTPVASAGSGTRAVTVTGTVTGLVPVARYHFRIVASTCRGCRAGTAVGRDATFITDAYQNPVSGGIDAPDPFVLDDGDRHDSYWAFVTGKRFPVYHSADLVHWTPRRRAMLARPAWVVRAPNWHSWAPSVTETAGPCPGSDSTSCYDMYYVGLSARYGVDCVAVATATRPGGPYMDRGPLSSGAPNTVGRPIGCGDSLGSATIDPSPFVDPASGQAYLYVSEDFACRAGVGFCGSADRILQPTISVIPLDPDHLHAAGPRVPLFSGAEHTWESLGGISATVEGPSMIFHNGVYYLLYSGGNWRGAYGMGYATGLSPTGPFTKSPANPILTGTRTVFGPGGGDTPVVGPHGGTWMIYHARAGGRGTPRTLRIDPLSWRTQGSAPDVPVIDGPSSTPRFTLP